VADRHQEVVGVLIFWPEVSQDLIRAADGFDALVGYQLLRGLRGSAVARLDVTQQGANPLVSTLLPSPLPQFRIDSNLELRASSVPRADLGRVRRIPSRRILGRTALDPLVVEGTEALGHRWLTTTTFLTDRLRHIKVISVTLPFVNF
jgi:hypothetical protein